MSKVIVSNELVNKLLVAAHKAKIFYTCYTGVLNDSFIFYDAQSIKISGIRRAKYIIIKNTYINPNRSELQLIVTDSDKRAEQYREEFEASQASLV